MPGTKGKMHQHGWQCWDELPCPLNCPFLLPITFESPWHHPQWDGSAHQHLPESFGSSWSRSCDSSSLWVLLQHEAAPKYGKLGIPNGAPGEVEFQDTGQCSHSREGALEATFPFPEGLGHVWKGNDCLIRWLENLYHCSLRTHSSSPIERPALQK